MVFAKSAFTLAVVASALGFAACEEDPSKENEANLQDGTWTQACAQKGDGGEGGGSSLRNINLQGDTGGGGEGGGGDEGSGDDEGGGDDGPSYNKDTLVFAEATFVYNSNEFSDTACATKKITMRMTGSYKAGDEAAGAATVVEGASNIDISITAIELAVHQDALIEYVNGAESECGVTAVKDAFFDPKNCSFMKKNDEGGGGSGGPAVGSVWYQIFKATDTTLQMGDERASDGYDGSTPEKRPIVLETSSFTKA